MDEADRQLFYAGCLEELIRRMNFLRVKLRKRRVRGWKRTWWVRRLGRHERAFRFLLRRAPAEVLEDLLEHRPEHKDAVFEALLWAAGMETERPQ